MEEKIWRKNLLIGSICEYVCCVLLTSKQDQRERNVSSDTRRFFSRAHVYGTRNWMKNRERNQQLIFFHGISSSFTFFLYRSCTICWMQIRIYGWPDWLACLLLWKELVFKTNRLTHKEIVINQLSYKSTFNWIKMTHFLGPFQ